MPLTRNPGAWFGRMILPWIAVAATQVGVTARLTRDSVLGGARRGLHQDRLRQGAAHAARALAARPPADAGHRCCRASASASARCSAAAAIVDQAFALDGVGQALLQAVKYNDMMTIMGAALITVILISLVNLVVDICQAALDPRIHLS